MFLVWTLVLVLTHPIHGGLGTAANPLTKPFDTQAACQTEANNAIKNGGVNVISAVCSE